MSSVVERDDEKLEGIDRSSAFAAPSTEMEIEIAAIWCELLGCKEVGIDDNFLMLGGSSLQVIQLKGILEEQFDISISMMTILTQGLTIRNLAVFVEELLLKDVDFSNIEDAIEKLESAGSDISAEETEA